jgi:hypothetical protein
MARNNILPLIMYLYSEWVEELKHLVQIGTLTFDHIETVNADCQTMLSDILHTRLNDRMFSDIWDEKVYDFL